uniref:Uncharacterized protein n=1 Tax=Anopheles culicifacies TaxID=139723 RepID=A0A182MC02_9DIPT
MQEDTAYIVVCYLFAWLAGASNSPDIAHFLFPLLIAVNVEDPHSDRCTCATAYRGRMISDRSVLCTGPEGRSKTSYYQSMKGRVQTVQFFAVFNTFKELTIGFSGERYLPFSKHLSNNCIVSKPTTLVNENTFHAASVNIRPCRCGSVKVK